MHGSPGLAATGRSDGQADEREPAYRLTATASAQPAPLERLRTYPAHAVIAGRRRAEDDRLVTAASNRRPHRADRAPRMQDLGAPRIERDGRRRRSARHAQRGDVQRGDVQRGDVQRAGTRNPSGESRRGVLGELVQLDLQRCRDGVVSLAKLSNLSFQSSHSASKSRDFEGEGLVCCAA
jgi:hypothetical protein